MEPERKLLLTIDVGERTLARAQSVLHQAGLLLALARVPLFLSDGYKESLTAIVTHCGHWVQVPRRQATGPAPKPRWMPLPEILYTQGTKTVRQRRLVDVQHRIVCSTLCQRTPALADARADKRHGRSPAVAPLDARDGGRVDGSGVELACRAHMPRAAMAAARRARKQELSRTIVR